MAKAAKKQAEYNEDEQGPTTGSNDLSPPPAESEKIPLNQLSIWKDNVRKTGADDNIAELEASIMAHGLINPLLVMKTFGAATVICGNRRLQAYKNLAARGAVAEDEPIACQVVGDEVDAKELSTAENVVRQKMHPLDEAEAFRYLAEKGDSLDKIGARFGVTVAIVKKRLALAEVSPVVKDALAVGQINLAAAQAFSVSDDHKHQEKLLQAAVKEGDLKDDGTLDIDEGDLRESLTEKKIQATDRRVRFVTVDVYKARGGTITQDMFTEGEDGIYIENSKLLDDLCREKLDVLKDILKSEAWSTIKTIVGEINYSVTTNYEQRPHRTVKLESADDINLKAFKKELATLPGRWDRNNVQAKQGAYLEHQISKLEDKTKEWPETTKAEACVLVGIDDDGFPDIRYGMMDRKTAEKKKKENDTGKKAAKKKAKPESKEAFPADALKKLSVHRSSALSAALLKDTDVALKLLAHSLTLEVLFSLTWQQSQQGFSLIETSGSNGYRNVSAKKGSIKGLDVIREYDDAWDKKLPKKPEDLWPWIAKLNRAQVDSLLTYLTALQVDDMDQHGKRHPHAAQIAEELDLDMTKWYTPTVDNLFGHMGKPQLLKAITEIRGTATTPAEEKMGKDQLAKIAEKEAAAKKWLPTPLQFNDAAPEKAAEKKAVKKK